MARIEEFSDDLATGLDWVLPSFDGLATSSPQCLDDEFHRLQVMSSVFGELLLPELPRSNAPPNNHNNNNTTGNDHPNDMDDNAFERITQLATRIFRAPLAMVSMVDLGRVFLLSNRGMDQFGLGDVREVPRKFGICPRTFCCVVL
jgi:hypothetical protein